MIFFLRGPVVREEFGLGLMLCPFEVEIGCFSIASSCGVVSSCPNPLLVQGNLSRLSEVPLLLAFQVWSLTQFYSVYFSQSRSGEKKCVFNKRTI